MNLDPEDPRLTDYLMGELSADESATFERAVAADPALQVAVREIEDMQRLLSNSLAPESKTLLPRQRDKILSAARHAEQSGKIKTLASHKRSLKPLMVPLAAAAIITLAILLLLRLPTGSTKRRKTKPLSQPTRIHLPRNRPAPRPRTTGFRSLRLLSNTPNRLFKPHQKHRRPFLRHGE